MKFILLLCFCSGILYCSAQDKNQFFALDANMNQTVLDSSKFILWIHEKEDSNWQWDYYRTWGPLVKSESFADHDGTILNGRSAIYNVTGNLDSLGIFDHGKKNGRFYKYKTLTMDSVITLFQYDYTQDSLVKVIDLQSDSIKNKIPDTTGKESLYPGGTKAWNTYISLNVKYPERALNKNIEGIVKIFFIVNKEGAVTDPYIKKSVEYSLDQESLRVINNSGTWDPAFQDGVYKKSYKIMPINYKLQ